ncbi:MAG TPA: thrombospondin type 3 repeat-containing protein [Polyangiaceae bacterium]|jgi:hypothetical protein
MKALVACFAWSFAMLLAASTWASPTYPPTIQSELMLEHMPDCVLCHRDDLGGIGTVIRPFGRTMLNHFMLTGGNNVNLLKAALQGDDAEHLDSDGDGVPDIDELRMGTDPNVGLSGVEEPLDVELPATGCALRARRQGGWGPAALLFVGLMMFRRRSRAARLR